MNLGPIEILGLLFQIAVVVAVVYVIVRLATRGNRRR